MNFRARLKGETRLPLKTCYAAYEKENADRLYRKED